MLIRNTYIVCIGKSQKCFSIVLYLKVFLFVLFIHVLMQVFTASEPSTYACMERMVCMNPSRSARARALTELAVEATALSR